MALSATGDDMLGAFGGATTEITDLSNVVSLAAQTTGEINSGFQNLRSGVRDIVAVAQTAAATVSPVDQAKIGRATDISNAQATGENKPIFGFFSKDSLPMILGIAVVAYVFVSHAK